MLSHLDKVWKDSELQNQERIQSGWVWLSSCGATAGSEVTGSTTGASEGAKGASDAGRGLTGRLTAAWRDLPCVPARRAGVCYRGAALPAEMADLTGNDGPRP